MLTAPYNQNVQNSCFRPVLRHPDCEGTAEGPLSRPLAPQLKVVTKNVKTASRMELAREFSVMP